jgi:hypothetical protein
MRDIRGDLQERAKLLEEEIARTQSEFDELMKQLKLEHQSKVEDLKSDLDAVQMVIKTEDRLLGSVRPRAELPSEPMPPQHLRWQQAQSKQPAPGEMRKAG